MAITPIDNVRIAPGPWSEDSMANDSQRAHRGQREKAQAIDRFENSTTPVAFPWEPPPIGNSFQLSRSIATGQSLPTLSTRGFPPIHVPWPVRASSPPKAQTPIDTHFLAGPFFNVVFRLDSSTPKTRPLASGLRKTNYSFRCANISGLPFPVPIHRCGYPSARR